MDEIDDAEGALMSATLMASGDATLSVSTTLGVDRTDQRLLRSRASDLGEVGNTLTSSAWRLRLVLSQCHVLASPLSFFLSVNSFCFPVLIHDG